MTTPPQPPDSAVKPNTTPGQEPGGTLGEETGGALAKPISSGGCLKWGAITLGAVILLLAIGVAIGVGVAMLTDSGGGTAAQYAGAGINANQNAQQVSEPQKSEGLEVGETYTASNGMQITLNSFQMFEFDQLGPHVCALATYQNFSGSQVSFQGLGDWSIRNTAGDRAGTGAGNGASKPTISGENDLQGGKLPPRGTVSGNVCFPSSGPGEYVLKFEPKISLFSSENATWNATI